MIFLLASSLFHNKQVCSATNSRKDSKVAEAFSFFCIHLLFFFLLLWSSIRWLIMRVGVLTFHAFFLTHIRSISCASLALFYFFLLLLSLVSLSMQCLCLGCISLRVLIVTCVFIFNFHAHFPIMHLLYGQMCVSACLYKYICEDVLYVFIMCFNY